MARQEKSVCDKKYTDCKRGYGRKVFERDGYRCQYCGRTFTDFEEWMFLSVDHIIPVHLWRVRRSELSLRFDGLTEGDENNLVTACLSCNTLCNREPLEIPREGSWQEVRGQLLRIKKQNRQKARAVYNEFWEKCVQSRKT